MEISRKNIKTIIEVIIAGYVTFALLFTVYAYLVVLMVILTLLIVSNQQKNVGPTLNWVALYNLYASGEDGKEFGALQVNQIPGRDWAHETIWDYERKPGRMYFIKNKIGMIDVVLLDPLIPSMEHTPLIDNLHTDIEWHNQGQFRNYIRRKWREMSKPVLDDILSSLDQGEFLDQIKNKLTRKENQAQAVNVANK